MKIVATILAAMLSGVALADEAQEWYESERQFEIRIGVAWYHDIQEDSADDTALYLQAPILKWERAYASFGGVIPLNYLERTRPSFSLNTRVGYWWEDCPKVLNFEVGVYGMVSSYLAIGVQLGFVNLRF